MWSGGNVQLCVGSTGVCVRYCKRDLASVVKLILPTDGFPKFAHTYYVERLIEICGWEERNLMAKKIKRGRSGTTLNDARNKRVKLSQPTQVNNLGGNRVKTDKHPRRRSKIKIPFRRDDNILLVGEGKVHCSGKARSFQTFPLPLFLLKIFWIALPWKVKGPKRTQIYDIYSLSPLLPIDIFLLLP